jgi:phage terminase small subunit
VVEPIKSVPKSTAIEQKVRRFRQKMRSAYGGRKDETQDTLLDLLTDAYSRYLGARQLIADEGLMIPGRAGERKRHPAALTERDCRFAMVKLLEQLEAGRDKSRERSDPADQYLEDALVGNHKPKLVS